MKRMIWIWIVCIGLMPGIAMAQTYKELWKEVSQFRMKDMPNSVIEYSDKIYAKANEEKNVSQMMAAFLTRANARRQISEQMWIPEKNALIQWAETEKDTIARAVLNNIVLRLMTEDRIAHVDTILQKVSWLMSNKNVLLNTSASEFLPMTESTDFSSRYFADNMYDLLARDIISLLIYDWRLARNPKVQQKILEVYDDLISAYSDTNREAAMLTIEAKVIYQTYRASSAQCRIDHTEAISQLNALTEEYSDMELCSDVYVKIASLYNRLSEPYKAVEVLRTAAQKYRKSSSRKIISGNISYVSRPYIAISMDEMYPERKVKMDVMYKNLHAFTLETYRLDLHPCSSLLNNADRIAGTIIKKYGKRVAGRKYILDGEEVYKVRNISLDYEVPASGVYILKLTPEGYKECAAYMLLHVSPFQNLTVVRNERTMEMIALDSETGHPVKGAEFVFYSKKDDVFVKEKSLYADDNGSILLDRNGYENMYYNIALSDNDFMRINPVYSSSAFKYKDVDREIERDFIFTDRPIYRPGQKVYVSGLKCFQIGDSVGVKPECDVKLKLYDSNNQLLEEKKLHTDEFGGYNTDFILPKTMLPGTFRIIAESGSAYIKVDEYKRPTFAVEFDKYKEGYSMNDSVSLSAQATTFAGAPVRMARVRYKVTRSIAWMWRWRQSGETVLKEGEVNTDENGKFVVGTTLAMPDDVASADRQYYVYKVKADVTSTSGETQMGEIFLSVGAQSLATQLDGWGETVAKESESSIMFRTVNLDRQPVSTTVSYNVYQADNSWEKKTKSVSGEMKSNTGFVPSDIYSLPSGRYIIEMSVRDHKGRMCNSVHRFTLFSYSDSKVPYTTPSWFYCDASRFVGSNPVDVYMGTSEKNVYLMVDLFNHNGHISSEKIVLNDEIRKFSFRYKKEYGKGLKVNFTMVRHGKLYRHDVYLQSPVPDKHLNIKWETFRDRLVPGRQEEWKMKITDKDGCPVKANVLAAMYDASLDQLYKASSNNYMLYFGSYWRGNSHISMSVYDFGIEPEFPVLYYSNGLDLLERGLYSSLRTYWDICSLKMNNSVTSSRMHMAGVKMASSYSYDYDGLAESEELHSMEAETDDVANAEGVEELHKEDHRVSLRENFSETAFFYPSLRTDSAGEVNIVFTLPDALTEWNFMAYAHTQEMKYGILREKIKASKPFMVQSVLPRFVRRDDLSSLAASVINMSEDTVRSKVTMTLSNPVSGKTIVRYNKEVTVAPDATANVDFGYTVGADADILVCKMVATDGEYTDGEQHYLPVVSDRERIVESIPVYLEGYEKKVVDISHLYNGGSRTATDKRLSVELVSNPGWYVIQALPSMSNPDTDDAISWASAYYANAIAMHIWQHNPDIQKAIEAWNSAADDDEFRSQLEKNASLKNIVLKESPWIMDAFGDKGQKQRISSLFNKNEMNMKQNLCMENIRNLQLEDGSWTWFRGMSGNLFITTTIVEYMARLRSKGVQMTPDMKRLYMRGLSYLAKAARKELDRKNELKSKGLGIFTVSETTLRYLYICSIDPKAASVADMEVNKSFVKMMLGHSADYTIYGKAVMAIVMKENGYYDEASDLLKSLREYTVYEKLTGRYFDSKKAYYSWNDTHIPTHVAAMEAMSRVDENRKELEEMRLWLLRQKQPQHWGTTTATADAVYAFMATGYFMPNADGVMIARAGNKIIASPKEGMGYVHKEVRNNSIARISFTNTSKTYAWGTVYAQCSEKMEDIKLSAANGLNIRREYLKDGKVLAETDKLKTGDRLTVRLTITADMDMDFVQIEDHRAACMEPVNQVSGYRWNSGIGYYQVSRDVSTQFFIDRMRKGSYQLEYNVYIDRVGKYSTGSASIQSAYAPSYSAHTQGQAMTVQ